MATINVGARVQVIDQSSYYRNQRGEVMSIVDGFHMVRLDGQKISDRTRFKTEALRGTTLANPLDYPE